MSRIPLLLVVGQLTACEIAGRAASCEKFARKDEGQTHYECFIRGSGGVGGWGEEEAWYPAFTCDSGYTPKSFTGSYVASDGFGIEFSRSNCLAANGDIREPGNEQIFAIDGDGGRFGAGELDLVCDSSSEGLWLWAETNDGKFAGGPSNFVRKLVFCNYAGFHGAATGVGAPYQCADGQVATLSLDRRTPACVAAP